jgi:hypothetical protein
MTRDAMTRDAMTRASTRGARRVEGARLRVNGIVSRLSAGLSSLSLLHLTCDIVSVNWAEANGDLGAIGE